MRTVIIILLALLLTVPAFTDEAVAGKSHILVAGWQNAYWVPLSGGRIENIYPATGVPTSVATDGQRYLVANGGRSVSLYGEGSIHPVASTELDLAAEGRAFAVWDGAHYRVAWNRMSGNARIATITRDGALVDTISLGNVHNVAALVANAGQLLLLEEQTLVNEEQPEDPHRRLRGILLGQDLQAVRATTLGEITGRFTFQTLLSAMPFGDGFYVAWYHGGYDYGGDRHPLSTILGTRIAADGTAPDVYELYDPAIGSTVQGRQLLRNAPEAFDVDLVNASGNVLAIVKRESSQVPVPLTGTYIGANGLTRGSKQFGTVELMDDPVRTRLDAVRLTDGRLVAVFVAKDVATVIALDSVPPPSLPRRRAVR